MEPNKSEPFVPKLSSTVPKEKRPGSLFYTKSFTVPPNAFWVKAK